MDSVDCKKGLKTSFENKQHTKVYLRHWLPASYFLFSWWREANHQPTQQHSWTQGKDGYTASTFAALNDIPHPPSWKMSSLLGQLNAREQSLFIAAIADVHDHNLHLDDKALSIGHTLDAKTPHDTYQQPRPLSLTIARPFKNPKKGTFFKGSGHSSDWARRVRDQQRDPRQLPDQHSLPAFS